MAQKATEAQKKVLRQFQENGGTIEGPSHHWRLYYRGAMLALEGCVRRGYIEVLDYRTYRITSDGLAQITEVE